MLNGTNWCQSNFQIVVSFVDTIILFKEISHHDQLSSLSFCVQEESITWL